MKHHSYFHKPSNIITLGDSRRLAVTRSGLFVCLAITVLCGLAGCSSDSLRISVQQAQPSKPVADNQPANSGDPANDTESPAAAAQKVVGPGEVDSNATVTKISDGDTVTVQFTSGTSEKVRFIGVDTPETKRPNTPIQCFGPEATQFTTALIPIGTKVRVERDVETRDRYGRLLGYVYRASDGLFVNQALAANGYANLLTYPPNVAHVDEFRDAVAEARDANRGLWQACPATVAP